MPQISVYGGFLLTIGMLLIIFSGIITNIGDYLNMFLQGNGKRISDFINSILGNIIFLIGIFIALIGYYLLPKPLFRNKDSRKLLENKFMTQYKRIFTAYKIFKYIFFMIATFVLIFSIIFIIELIVSLIVLTGLENESLIEISKSFYFLYNIIPLQSSLLLSLAFVLSHGFLNNVHWLFEVPLFRRSAQEYVLSIIAQTLLLYVSWIFLVIIFIIFFSVNDTLSLVNNYMQTFDRNYIDAINMSSNTSLQNLRDSLPFIQYYLITWLFIGISSYFVLRFRPMDFKTRARFVIEN